MTDPTAPEDPPTQPVPEPEPPAPQIDIETAYDVIAQREGWDPRLTRYEIQEHKRKREELDRERREFEAERSRRYEPLDDNNADPYMRRMDRLERILIERDERERKKEESAARINQVGQELDSAYTSYARQVGMTREQMDAKSRELYETINDLYPEPEMVQRVGADRAVRNAFRNMMNNGGNSFPSNRAQARDRRTPIYIPGTAPSSNGAAAPDENDVKRRPGESLEAHVERLRELAAKMGVGGTPPEGTKMVFE